MAGCKDCPPGGKRATPHAGPRCATHHRLKRRDTKATAHDRYLQTRYGIDRIAYLAIMEVQGGACAICQRARGIARNLSVDHDHQQARLDGHPHEQGCANCVRGLLCVSCNKMLAHVRDDPAALLRAVNYLASWPSRAVLASVTASSSSSGPTTRATRGARARRAGAQGK